MNTLFDISGRVVVITEGSGFLGTQYRNTLTSAGAVFENFDIDVGVDVTNEVSFEKAVASVIETHGKIDGLIMNAAANPKVDEVSTGSPWSPYNEFPTEL